MKQGSMKLGFIGTGNMAGAIMGGIIKNEIFRPEEIIGADISPAGRERVKETYGIHVTADNREAARKAEVLILSAANDALTKSQEQRAQKGLDKARQYGLKI